MWHVVSVATVAASLISSAAAQSSGSYGTCSGAGANPFVYNFEINGYPAKILNDASTTIPVASGVFGEPEPATRALELRNMNGTHFNFDNNVLYIQRPDGGMLIDAGAGPNGPGLVNGTVLETLKAEGIEASSIKNIFITHVHVDHHGGIVNNWEDFVPVYPEATIHVSTPELENILLEDVQFGDSGLDTEQRALMSRVGKGVFAAVEDKIKAFDFNDEYIIPGVKARPALWHNIGCASFEIDDGDSKVIVAALNHQVLSVENPQFIFDVDYDKVASVAGRYELLDYIMKNKYTLLPEHALFPGLVTLTPVGPNYQTQPLPWKGSHDSMSVCV